MAKKGYGSLVTIAVGGFAGYIAGLIAAKAVPTATLYGVNAGPVVLGAAGYVAGRYTKHRVAADSFATGSYIAALEPAIRSALKI